MPAKRVGAEIAMPSGIKGHHPRPAQGSDFNCISSSCSKYQYSTVLYCPDRSSVSWFNKSVQQGRPLFLDLDTAACIYLRGKVVIQSVIYRIEPGNMFARNTRYLPDLLGLVSTDVKMNHPILKLLKSRRHQLEFP